MFFQTLLFQLIAAASNLLGLSIANSTYSGDSFDVSAQATNPYDVKFSSSGLKMYVLCSDNDRVYEYDLDIPFDITTSAYNSVSFSVAAQSTLPTSLDFSTGGTKMYVSGADLEIIYQYSLSPAWDLSSASYTGTSFTVPAAKTTQLTFFKVVSTDGLVDDKLYLNGSIGSRILEYDLTTNGLISSAVFANESSLNTGGSGNKNGAWLTKDGKNLITLPTGASSPPAQQLVLQTAFDASSLVNPNISYDPVEVGTERHGLYVSEHVDKYFISTPVSDFVFAYDLNSKTFGLGNYTRKGAYDISSFSEPNSAITISNGGEYLYVLTIDVSNTKFRQYKLSTPYDVTTASSNGLSSNFNSYEISLNDIIVASDGSKIFAPSSNNQRVVTFSMSTDHDISALSNANQVYNPAEMTTIHGICLNHAGTKMYLTDINEIIYQYTLSTAHNVTTATYDNKSFDVSAVFSHISSISLTADGKKLYVVKAGTSGVVVEYTLSTPGDITTATLATSKDFSADITRLNKAKVNSIGTQIYILDSTNEELVQADLFTE